MIHATYLCSESNPKGTKTQQDINRKRMHGWVNRQVVVDRKMVDDFADALKMTLILVVVVVTRLLSYNLTIELL